MGRLGSQDIDEVYRRYSERVFRFIYWRIGERREDAEELTLDTFLTALELCQRFDGRASVFVWLCGIAKLKLIHHHRHHTRQKRATEQPAVSIHDLNEAVTEARASGRTPIEELLDRISASQVIDLAMQRISPDEKEALVLRLVDGLSIREISTQMKRSEDGADALIRRAKSKLREIIERLQAEENAA
jgi:RNA polymerase sigma-70 factor (ECF subfamily)